MSNIIQQIESLFERRGHCQYGDEAVSQWQHAAQCAQLAIEASSSDATVVAALLHDIGHIVGAESLPENCESNLDDLHESVGHKFLANHFPASIVDPIRLHVAAKRYLCTTQPSYQSNLSPTSLKSFMDQGAQMSRDELAAFESEPHCEAAIELRQWDDLAKDPAKPNPSFHEFTAHIQSVLNSTD